MGVVVSLIGLCIGSFLAAFTYREQKGLSVWSGRSFCPHCKTKISWFDNIPILSFLHLKGRCRNCHKKISLRYPLIEASTMAVFLAYFHYYFNCGNTFTGSILCSLKGRNEMFSLVLVGILTSILIAVMVVDLESKIIPDDLIFLGILVLIAFYILTGYQALFLTFFTAFTVSVFFLSIHLLTRGRGMGLGDVKFVILGGLLVGWPQSVIWLFLAFLTGALVGTILILLGKAKFGREIAFGPFLAATLLFTVIYGEKILSWYLKTN